MDIDKTPYQAAMDAAMDKIRDQFKDLQPVVRSQAIAERRERVAREQEEELAKKMREMKEEMDKIGYTDYTAYSYYKKGYNLAQSGGSIGPKDGDAYGPYYADFQKGYDAGLN